MTPDAAAQAAIDRHHDREEQALVEDMWAAEWDAEDALESRRDDRRDEAGWDL